MELTWRVPLTAPTVFLLITVVSAAALGGWKGGVASGLVALLYLGWLLTDAGAPDVAPRHPALAAARRAGALVSIYTVARELGHQSDEMVKRIYAHLGATRHRSDVVEYRVANHLEQLGDRLRRLGFVTGTLLAAGQWRENENPAPTEVEAGGQLPEWARRDSNARPLAPEASALSS